MGLFLFQMTIILSFLMFHRQSPVQCYSFVLRYNRGFSSILPNDDLAACQIFFALSITFKESRQCLFLCAPNLHFGQTYYTGIILGLPDFCKTLLVFAGHGFLWFISLMSHKNRGIKFWCNTTMIYCLFHLVLESFYKNP